MRHDPPGERVRDLRWDDVALALAGFRLLLGFLLGLEIVLAALLLLAADTFSQTRRRRRRAVAAAATTATMLLLTASCRRASPRDKDAIALYNTDSSAHQVWLAANTTDTPMNTMWNMRSDISAPGARPPARPRESACRCGP